MDAARGIGLSQRQQVEQQVDEDLRVAADVAAVGQDLCGDLRGQRLRAATLQRRSVLDAESVFRQGQRGDQALVGGGGARGRGGGGEAGGVRDERDGGREPA